jgi:RNA polymerase sigma-70 factor (ECF subfamily)
VEQRDDDALLVSRLIAGDDVALGVIYDRYAPVLFGIAFRVTGNRQLASEVVQEVVMRVWERPGRIDLRRGSLRTFLAVLAHRRSVDEVRREVRHDLTESRVVDPPYDHGHEAVVVDTLDRAQRKARLIVAMDRLPPAQRQAVDLAYFEGHTFTDVARTLGIPEGTAKSRLRLGLERLRELLGNDTEGQL